MGILENADRQLPFKISNVQTLITGSVKFIFLNIFITLQKKKLHTSLKLSSNAQHLQVLTINPFEVVNIHVSWSYMPPQGKRIGAFLPISAIGKLCLLAIGFVTDSSWTFAHVCVSLLCCQLSKLILNDFEDSMRASRHRSRVFK